MTQVWYCVELDLLCLMLRRKDTKSFRAFGLGKTQEDLMLFVYIGEFE